MVSTFPLHAQVWVHHTPLTSSPDLIDNSERYILVFVTRRKAGVSREQFVEHYEKVHPSYSLRMPGLLCYRQSVLLEETGPGGMGMDQFDALSEYHYVSKKAYREAMESDIGKECRLKGYEPHYRVRDPPRKGIVGVRQSIFIVNMIHEDI